MTTTLPTHIADFTSVLDDVVAAAGAGVAAAAGEDDECGGGSKRDSKSNAPPGIQCGSGSVGLLSPNLPKFPRHPLDSLLTPAASPEEDSLEPWIQTV